MGNNTVEFKIKITDINSNVVKKLTGEFENANEAVQMLTHSVREAGSGIDRAASQAFKWGQVKDAVMGVMDTLKDATSPANEFEQAMRSANTMAGKGEEDYGKLKKAVHGLSTEIPIARDLLANGLYQTISNGVPENNWVEFLDRSARAATGGLANLEKVVTVTSTVIKNYGLSWDAAGSIQDKIQMTAKNGVTSFEQMADSLPRVSGNAATLGVSIDELMATFATLTGVSGNTAEVSTQLSAIFTALVKPSSEAAKMAKEMGIQFNAVSVKAAGGLVPFLQQLNTKINEYAASTGQLSQEIYASLFGSSEALRALIPLTGELSGKFVENTQAMASSAGSIDKAFEQMNGTAQSAEQRLKNYVAGISDFAMGTVNAIMPVASFVSQTGMAVVQLNALRQVVASFSLKQYVTSSKLAAITQVRFNEVLALGKRSIYIYQMQLLAARKSIAATTGATRLMNIAIAASPYLIAAAAVATLGFAIYKYVSASNDAEKSQQRLNDAMQEMNREVATERNKLDSLFEPLNRAKVGTDEWKKAKERVVSQYGDYLQKIGIEIKDVNTARIAYNKLNEAILNTARSRAMDAATSGASGAYAEKEGGALGNIRKSLYGGISKDGGITASEAGKAFGQIQTAVRSGQDIPQEVKDILLKIKKPWMDQEGNMHENGTAEFIYNQLSGVKKAREAYEKEMADAKAMFGNVTGISSTSPGNPLSGDTDKENDGLKKKSLTLDEIDAKIRKLKEDQGKASDQEGRSIQRQINQLEVLKKSKESAMGIGVKSKGSLDGLESELSKKKAELSSKPVGTASIQLQLDVDTLETQISGIKTWLEKEAFSSKYGEIKLPVDMKPEGRGIAKMVEDIQDEMVRKKPKVKINTLTDKTKGDAKLPVYETPDIAKPLADLERWNKQVEQAREKNASMLEGLGCIGTAMGNVGNAIGGAAGEWLNWGANAVQAIAAAIPQIVALIGAQSTQATANTAVAATGAASSVASIPIVGPILAIAAVASVLASLAAVPKFAAGGIAYGPTLGLFGEYSGAQNNPEVVAPLNRLKNLIQPSGAGGEVVFTIDGRVLRGILNKVNRVNQRTK